MNVFRAFHSDPAIKAKYVGRLQAHQLADQFVQGLYVNGEDPETQEFRGCAVGCTLHRSTHEGYEIELGIPVALAYLHDIHFEQLSATEAPQFAVDFLQVIPVGADLSQVFDRWVMWTLSEIGGLVEDQPLKSLFEEGVRLYERRLQGDFVEREWIDLRSRARALARALDLDLAHDLDLALALDLARARDLALDLAHDRARARARARDRDLAWRMSAEKLLELLREAPVAEGVAQ